MKKIYLTCILAIVSCCSYAQWISSGTYIYNTNTGNIGIGTTGDAGDKLQISSSNNPASSYGLSIGPYPRRLALGYDATNGYGYIISTNTGTAYTPLALQQYGGNVGIGTTTPGATLDVVNYTNGAIALQAGAGQGSQALYYATNTQPGGINTPRVVIRLSADGTPGYSYPQNWYLKAGKNGTPRGDGTDRYTNQLIFNTSTAADGYSASTDVLTLIGSGNVGIGTTSPLAKLDVSNGIKFGNGASGSNVLSPNNAYVYIGQTNFATEDPENSSGYFFGINPRMGTDRLLAIEARTNDGPGAITFNTYSGTGTSRAPERMRITSTGNILIGQTSQANTAYKLDVNGYARANEIVVNTTGADFVFKPTYHLLSLKSVASYIKENHHLPEIQSAAEMQKDGLNLGENQTKLLQKVEELTLYLIDKDKEVATEHKTNKLQQEQINLLKKQVELLTKKLKQ